MTNPAWVVALHEDRRARHRRGRRRLALRRRRARVRPPRRRRHRRSRRSGSRTGDRVRVNGATGVVELFGAGSRAPRLLLREQVKEAILERILAGEYAARRAARRDAPRARVRTSQVPVREALRDLELLRFVESEPFRGARVRDGDAGGDARDLPRARGARGGRGPRGGGAPGRGVDDLEAGARRDARGRRRRRPPRAGATTTSSFHRLIVEASGNSTFSRSGCRCGSRRGRWSRRSGPASTSTPSLRSHAPILDALRAPRPRRRRPRDRAHFEFLGNSPEGEAMTRLVDLSMPVHPEMLTFPRVPPPDIRIYESWDGVRRRASAPPSTARRG